MYAAALLLAAASPLFAQAAAPVPKFEVVSIKPCDESHPASQAGKTPGSPGRLILECQTPDSLIRNAYLLLANGTPWPVNPRSGIPTQPLTHGQLYQQIKGSTGWIKSGRFTIEAKADSPARVEMMRGPMMQTLLKDRFKLKFHWEKREVPVYELTAGKGGLKLQPAKEGDCIVVDPAKGPPLRRAPGQAIPPAICGGFRVSKNGGIDVKGVTLNDLCMLFSLSLDRDVIDKTGVPGMFDVHLELSFDELHFGSRDAPPPSNAATPPVASDPGGTVMTAVRKLGLKLEPGKMLADFLVIDHIEKPSAN